MKQRFTRLCYFENEVGGRSAWENNLPRTSCTWSDIACIISQRTFGLGIIDFSHGADVEKLWNVNQGVLEPWYWYLLGECPCVAAATPPILHELMTCYTSDGMIPSVLARPRQFSPCLPSASVGSTGPPLPAGCSTRPPSPHPPPHPCPHQPWLHASLWYEQLASLHVMFVLEQALCPILSRLLVGTLTCEARPPASLSTATATVINVASCLCHQVLSCVLWFFPEAV